MVRSSVRPEAVKFILAQGRGGVVHDRVLGANVTEGAGLDLRHVDLFQWLFNDRQGRFSLDLANILR